MLTVRAAAARASVSEGLIRQWLRDGLSHYRLGASGKRGKIMIPVEDLDGWLAAFKVERKRPEPSRVPALKKPHLAFKHLKLS